MKTRLLLRIWPLRPTAAARSLQLCCVLVAGAIALTLATAPTAGAATRRPVAALLDNPHLLFLQRRCIDRVLWLTNGQSQEAVLAQINVRCMMPPGSKPTTAGARLPSCERPFGVHLTPATSRVTGCLGGS